MKTRYAVAAIGVIITGSQALNIIFQGTILSGNPLPTSSIIAAFVGGAAAILATIFLKEKTGAYGLLILYVLPLLVLYPTTYYTELVTGPAFAVSYMAVLGAVTANYFVEPSTTEATQ